MFHNREKEMGEITNMPNMEPTLGREWKRRVHPPRRGDQGCYAGGEVKKRDGTVGTST